MTQAERIKQLEAQVSSLRARLHLLEQQPRQTHVHHHPSTNPYWPYHGMGGPQAMGIRSQGETPMMMFDFTKGGSG